MRYKYLLFSLSAVSIWAGNTIVNKLAAGSIPPGAIAFLRWLLAFIVLSPFVAGDAWRHRETIRKHLPKLAVLGLLGMALCQGIGYYAARHTSATNMALFLSMVPLLTFFLSAIVHGEKPSALAIFGGIFALLGIILVLGQGNPVAVLANGIGKGDAMMLMAVLAYAGYSTLLKSWSGPLPVLTSLYAQIACAVVFLLPVYLVSGPVAFSRANMAMIAYAAIAGSIIAPAIWMSAVQNLGPGRTSIFMNLIPIITALIAAVLLDEKLHAYHLIGGGMTIAGVVLSQRPTSRTVRLKASTS
jgi:drug/metabolite transporter (DMT)-like permease